MILPVLGLVLGFILGYIIPVEIPSDYTKLFSVALLASLDSIFGGLRAALTNKFDGLLFSSGFFVNGILAAVLVYIGDHLGLDLYYVALLAFGFRIFKNLALLRRIILNKHSAAMT